jgi:hypothetical protein
MPEDIASERWQEILGDHVNNLLHLKETLFDTDDFIKVQKTQPDKRQFSDHEEHLLRLYAVIHDMVEVILDDTPDPQKANKEYAMQLEMEILHNMVGVLYKFDSALVSDMHEAIEDIGKGKNEFLTKAFRTIECIGYAKVAIPAERHIQDAETDALKEGLTRLVVSVAKRGYPEIQKQKSEFVYAQQFTNAHDQLFHQALLKYDPALAS